MSHKETILRALDNYMGDNAERARRCFRGSDLNKLYGESGQTCGAILAEYEAHETQVLDTIKFVKDTL